MENIQYQMEDMLLQIRKIEGYTYQSSNFMRMFNLHDDKPYVIKAILGTREYNKDNYNNAISDIIDYYNNNNNNEINELIDILKNIIPDLEIPKKKKYEYYQNGKYPNKLLIIGGYNNLMRNRITSILDNL
jgi:hypothetical protein